MNRLSRCVMQESVLQISLVKQYHTRGCAVVRNISMAVVSVQQHDLKCDIASALQFYTVEINIKYVTPWTHILAKRSVYFYSVSRNKSRRSRTRVIARRLAWWSHRETLEDLSCPRMNGELMAWRHCALHTPTRSFEYWRTLAAFTCTLIVHNQSQARSGWNTPFWM